MKPRIVLLGAGHAHLHTLARTGVLVERGFDVTLVAPEPFWYSGLATGVLGGAYPPSLDQVDTGGMVEAQGGRWIRQRAVGVAPRERTVLLADGTTLPWDVLSLGVGSRVRQDRIPGSARHAVPVKPLHALWTLRQRVVSALDAGEAPRVVVLGGGDSGVEVAANLLALAARRGAPLPVTLVTGRAGLLPRVSARAARGTRAELRRRGLALLEGLRAARVEKGRVVLEGGGRIAADVVVDATGLEPASLPRGSGLPTDPAGALHVDARLECPEHRGIFGGGDCIAFGPRPLPRIGVHAVRQGPVLYQNLVARLDGRPLRTYQPQHRALLILNLGARRGLATWGPLHWRGGSAFWLKDRIDRRFMRAQREALARATG